MADPISAAGFATGAVSLGIQVRQGLVSYYANYKSFDDDIDRIMNKLRGLEETLENLKNGITRFQSANAKEVDDVNKKILSCDDGIHRLQAVLDKCRASPSTNSVHKFVLKTLYPFKKTTLYELDASVRDLQGNLDTGLLSLLIGASYRQREDLSVLISTTRTRNDEFEEVKHGIQSTAAEVGGVRDGVKSIQRQTDIIQASTSQISLTLVTGFQNLEIHQQNHLVELNERVGTLTELIKKISQDQCSASMGWPLYSELPESQRTIAMQNFVRLIGKPSLMLTACEDIDYSENVPQSSSMAECRAYDPSSSRRFFRRRVCFCPPSAYSLEFGRSHQSQPHGPIWGAKFNSSAVIHQKSCALFKYAERGKSWNLRVVYCGRIVARALRLSIDLTWGAGGYSISPSLSCNRVVSSQSAIFRLVEDNGGILDETTAAECSERIDSLMRSIGRLYQDRKASVHDIDEDGDNILHKIAKWDVYIYRREEISAVSIGLFKYLSDCGVCVNRVNAQGKTCLDELLSQGEIESLRSVNLMVKGLVDLGAEFVGIDDIWTLVFAENARRFEELARVSDFNDIGRAVLRRSESELQKVLQCSRHLINQPQARGLRPLHLAAGWPCGIEVLLSYGVNINVVDDWGLYPVDHAIYLACPESLVLFAKTDPNLLVPVPWGGVRALDLAIYLAAFNSSDQAIRLDIAKSVITIEANQRRKLRALTSHYLPQSPICMHPYVEDQLLDVRAFDAVAALKQHGVSIPTSLELHGDRETVYHIPCVGTEILNSLWEAGFRDINEPDPSGRTPLMLQSLFADTLTGFLERVGWFLDKGVDAQQKIQHIHQNSNWKCTTNVECSCLKSGHTVMHILAFSLTLVLRSYDMIYDRSFEMKDPRLLALLNDIVNNEIRDACKCGCSSTGCQAINVIVKGYREFFQEKMNPRLWFDNLIWFIPAAIANNSNSETAISETIRALTFKALGLTHTCCRESEDPFHQLPLTPFGDEDDISEIQDEEREDLQLLEDLLLEFEQQRRDKPSSLRKFVVGYWWTRMQEVWSEEDLPDVSEREGSPEMLSDEKP